MGKKLKSALFHFTRETNQVGDIGSRKEMYICNYCKWKTVINVTRMFEHLLKKCSKCPPIVGQTSGLSQLTHVRRNSDSDSDSVNITTSSVQKRVPMSIMQFVDSINDNEQVRLRVKMVIYNIET
ncbi:unnamed protein product [Aphis gossypii]|uniref:Uncharacterized protein n=1 Tax=Aphis gossypii TaxID=80765 RepID=A0A9P0JBY1_APHGO|nr:unnamed protein product [Aphis gossypii]